MDAFFRPAAPADLDAIWDIILQAQVFMHSQGLDQWQDGYPERAQLAEDIAKGQSYLLETGGQAAATAVLQTEHEPDYDHIYEGAWRLDAPCACIHRLAAAGGQRGKGAAHALLSALEQHALQNGISYLRVDTHEDNRPMRRFLEKNGFVYCGVVYMSRGHQKRVAYDKPLPGGECPAGI